ncbi:MAG: SDR family oxidoreductase [Halieaceae bacterium]|nr:SDR family oxidoreductase [Halieaceae bacterium]MDG2411784.1 SDR family oxidoreductase [Halioglobus sp.]
MSETALITGASGGIGAEFARIHAATGGDLVLVARNREKLEEIKADLESSHGISVLTIAMDLSRDDAADRVFAQTEAAGIKVSLLINNAGVGGHGKFYERKLRSDQAMMQLNMGALVTLTHLYLEAMIQRGSGKVLNVASTAAFIPGPLQAVYYATKAFVLSFSEALAEELSGTGVTVTALCPGPVMTGFAEAGDLEGVRVFQFGASAESVAICGYNAMRKGKRVVVNSKLLGFVLKWIAPLIPRRILLKFSRLSLEKSS